MTDDRPRRPDLAGMSKCFQPRMWFGDFSDEGGRLMWVYRPTEDGSWQVGFFYPDGTWFTESVYTDKDAAAARVRWLSGGNG